MTTKHPAYRVTSDLLCLWALCGKAACRRARACSCVAGDCLARFAPLVSEDARCGALALLQGAKDGVGIGEVRRFVARDIAALEAWTAQVQATLRATAPNAKDNTMDNGQARKTCDHEVTLGS
jgi:hypothetical protein